MKGLNRLSLGHQSLNKNVKSELRGKFSTGRDSLKSLEGTNVAKD